MRLTWDQPERRPVSLQSWGPQKTLTRDLGSNCRLKASSTLGQKTDRMNSVPTDGINGYVETADATGRRPSSF